MFSYFGGKGRIGKRYPKPRYPLVIEPFAGAAWYSVLNAVPHAWLYDTSPFIYETWKWIIREATEADCYGNDHPPGQPMHRLEPLGKDYFFRFRGNQGTPYPRKISGTRSTHSRPELTWQRIQVAKGWLVFKASYQVAPDVPATWFIDPPYVGQGDEYPQASSALDYAELACWCRSRRGQVIVCEKRGASWLPFVDFLTTGAMNVNDSTNTEVIWTNDCG